MEMSNLRTNFKNSMTSGFPEVLQVRCVRGSYPERLLKSRKDYQYESKYDAPETFSDDQLYITFELRNAGQQLETFVLKYINLPL